MHHEKSNNDDEISYDDNEISYIDNETGVLKENSERYDVELNDFLTIESGSESDSPPDLAKVICDPLLYLFEKHAAVFRADELAVFVFECNYLAAAGYQFYPDGVFIGVWFGDAMQVAH